MRRETRDLRSAARKIICGFNRVHLPLETVGGQDEFFFLFFISRGYETR